MRKFYLVYQDRISDNLYRNFAIEKSEKVYRIFDDEKPFLLSWSHYVKLMRIENEVERISSKSIFSLFFSQVGAILLPFKESCGRIHSIILKLRGMYSWKK